MLLVSVRGAQTECWAKARRESGSDGETMRRGNSTQRRLVQRAQ